MQPVRFDDMEGLAGMDQGALYRPLPIQWVTLEGGLPAVVSHWKPSPEDIEKIVAGRTLKLTVVSNVVNPVKIEVD